MLRLQYLLRTIKVCNILQINALKVAWIIYLILNVFCFRR